MSTGVDFCSEGPEDDTEVLLVATGSTSAARANYTSHRVQFYEKDLVTGTYAYRESSVCNHKGLPHGSSLGVGAVVASEETVLICDGYTETDIKECYRFTEGEGFQAFGIEGEVRSMI